MEHEKGRETQRKKINRELKRKSPLAVVLDQNLKF